MSALDRLERFSSESQSTSKKNPREGLPFSDSTIDGYFFNSLLLHGFNLTEMKPIIETEGNQLIISIAGSGKTTLIDFMIIHDIITGLATKVVPLRDGGSTRVLDKILVSTFLNRGANELRDNVLNWQRRLGYSQTGTGISFMTLHAEFKSALTSMGIDTSIIENDVAKSLFRSAVNELGITRQDGYDLTNEDYEILSTIVAYRRNRLDKYRYAHASCGDYNLPPVVLDALVDKYKQKRREHGKLDFEDLQEILLDGLEKNINVRNLIANRYNYIYLDEFQDVSQIQYEILKYYRVNAKKVVVIGDDDQTIYTWRGSDVDIITNLFERDFNAKVSKLSFNYRCPSNILNPIKKSIELNTMRHKKDIISAHAGGELFNFKYSSMKDMAKGFLDRVSVDDESMSDSLVLCRTNFDGAIPAFLLEMSGITDFSIMQNMTLSSPLPRKLLGTTAIITDKYTMGLQTTLGLLFTKRTYWKAKSLVEVCKSNKCSIFDIPDTDIEHNVPELLDLLRVMRQLLSEKREIDAYRYFLGYLTLEVFSSDSTYCQNAKAYIGLLQVLLETGEFNDIYDFRDRIDEINARLSARVNRQDARITISTVHDAKGGQKDSVHIWNASEGSFPSVKTDLTNLGQLEEERRLFYIAWTRAKKRLTTYSLNGKESMFLKETGVSVVVPQEISGRLGKKSVMQEIDDSTISLQSALDIGK